MSRKKKSKSYARAARTSEVVSKVSHKDNLICSICGLTSELADSTIVSKNKGSVNRNEIFVCCGEEVESSSVLLDSNNSTITICGSVMCYTCHNQFGFISIDKCPFHLACDKNIYRKEDKKHNVSINKKSHEVTTKLIFDPAKKNHFFRPKYSYFNYTNNNESHPVSCKYCHTTTRHELNKNMICYFNPSEIPDSSKYLRSDFKVFYEQMRSGSFSTKCLVHNNQDHVPFMNANAGDPSSCISNSVFVHRSVIGHGDCGFASIKFAIETLPIPEFRSITDMIFEYVLSRYDYYEEEVDYLIDHFKDTKKDLLKSFNTESKYMNALNVDEYKKLPNEFRLPIKLLKDAIFFPKLDFDYIEQEFKENKDADSFFSLLLKDFHSDTNKGRILDKQLSNPEREGLVRIGDDMKEWYKYEKGSEERKKLEQNANISYIGSYIAKWIKVFRRNSFQHKTSYFLSSEDLLALPFITQNNIGVLYSVKDDENTDHTSCAISDGDYNLWYHKHILKECSNFILLRNINYEHYDLYIDVINGTAVHSTSEDSLAKKKILSLVNESTYEALLGSRRGNPNSSQQNHKVHPYLENFPNLFDFCLTNEHIPPAESCYKDIEDWITSHTPAYLDKNDLYNVAFQITPWLEDAKKFTDETNDVSMDDGNIMKKVLFLLTDECIPFIISTQDNDYENNNTDFVHCLGYFKKVAAELHNKERVNGNKNGNEGWVKTKTTNFAFKICDIRKQTFNPFSDTNEFVTKYIKEVFKDSKAKDYFEIDQQVFTYEYIRTLLLSKTVILPTKQMLEKVLRNVIYSLLTLHQCSSGPFCSKIFTDMGISHPDVYPLYEQELCIIKELKQRTTESNTDIDEKQFFYSLYVGYKMKDQIVHKHLLLYDTEFKGYLMKYIFKEYSTNLQHGFILCKRMNIKSSVIQFFGKIQDNPDLKKPFFKKIAKLILAKFILQFKTFGSCIDGDKVNELEMSHMFMETLSLDQSNEQNSIDMKSLSNVSSLGSSILRNEVALSQKNLNMKEVLQKKNDTDYGEMFSDDSSESSTSIDYEDTGTDDGDKLKPIVKESTRQDQIGNWFSYLKWFEHHDFFYVIGDDISSDDNRNTEFTFEETYSKKSYKISDVLLMLVFYRKFEGYLIFYLTKYMKQFLKHEVENLKTLVAEEWKCIVFALTQHMGYSENDTLKDGFFWFDISKEDISKECDSLKRQNLFRNDNLAEMTNERTKNDLKDIDTLSVTSDSTIKSYPDKSSIFLNPNILDEHKVKGCPKTDMRKLNSILSKMSRHCFNKYMNHNSQSNHELVHKFKSEEKFDNRLQSNYSKITKTTDESAVVIKVQNIQLRLRNIKQGLTPLQSLRMEDIDLAISILNEENNNKTRTLCIPTHVYAKAYKHLDTVGYGNVGGKDTIANLLKQVKMYLDDDESLFKKYDNIVFISSKGSKVFHYQLVVMNFRDKIIKFIDPFHFQQEQQQNEVLKTHKQNRIFFLNLFSLIVVMFGGWKDISFQPLKNYIDQFFYPPVINIPQYIHKSSSKESSVAMLMNVYGYITNKLAVHDKNIDHFYSSDNILYFRNFVISLFMQYDKCMNIRDFVQAKKHLIQMEGKEEHEYFSADNLIDISKLCITNTEVNNTDTSSKNNVNKSGKNNDIPNILNLDDDKLKKSDDDIRSLSSIGTKMSLDKEHDTTFEEEHAMNFARMRISDTDNDKRDSLRKFIGDRGRIVSHRKRKVKMSDHCNPGEVTTFEDVAYEATEEQKKKFIKLPTPPPLTDYEKISFHQGNVHREIKYINNKLPCLQICCLKNKYAVTTIIDKSNKLPDVIEAEDEEHEYDIIMRSKNIYPLERECIEEIRKNSKDDERFTKKQKKSLENFLKKLHKQKRWHKMNEIFRKCYKLYFKEKRDAWAYHYLDYHAIKYNADNHTLVGYCYSANKQIYKETLNNEWVRIVENYHSQYMFAYTNPGHIIPLNIGKGQDTDEKKEKKLYKTENNVQTKDTNMKNCDSKNESMDQISIAKLSDDSNVNKKGNFNPTHITHHQGHQHTCFEYSIYSALDAMAEHLVAMNNNKVLRNKIFLLRDSMKQKIRTIQNQKSLIHTVKEVFDSYGWLCQDVSKTKEYLQTNYEEFESFCNDNKFSIITINIIDHYQNNNHWVSIYYGYIFNTVLKKPKPLTQYNLESCTEMNRFKQIGKIYQ